MDDEPSVLASTSLLLSDLGFEIATRADPTEVLPALAEERPDILLQDVRMPGLDLGALLAKIRSDPAISQIPVLLFSAGMNLEDLSTKVGAQGILEKPFRPDDLVSAIMIAVRVANGPTKPANGIVPISQPGGRS